MSRQRERRRLAIATAASCLVLAGCSDSGDSIDPTPERKDGSSSREFEPDDIERAEEASPRVKEYCAGAVSEAQRVGCESHVTEEEIP